MTYKPPKFGDVYEWDVPTGTVRWLVIGPALNGQAGEYEALLVQSTPMFADDPALGRPTTIGIGGEWASRGHPQVRISGDDR